jgi:hypothetical protein
MSESMGVPDEESSSKSEEDRPKRNIKARIGWLGLTGFAVTIATAVSVSEIIDRHEERQLNSIPPCGNVAPGHTGLVAATQEMVEAAPRLHLQPCHLGGERWLVVGK